MLPNLQETVDLVTFTEEILNGKVHFLCSVSVVKELKRNEVIPMSKPLEKVIENSVKD